MINLKFEEMNLTAPTLKAIKDLGYKEATPIQSRSIELILSGRDLLGQSQTGTGKTAAFGIPCIELLDPSDRRLQSIILCPTRELAMQVSEELRKLLKYRDDLKVLPIYGGQSIERQILALKKGVQIVVGTPGRVMDHMRRNTLKLDAMKMVILDEADEMLDMGFREDIETILKKTPDNRQTVMFSATMPKAILELTKTYQKNAAHIRVTPKELVTVPSIYQAYYEVREKDKLEALCRIIDISGSELSLVFCNTKRRVDQVVEALQERGYFAESLHGDLKQAQRDMVMKKFRNRTLEILVATDVAARGIDVNDIGIVFNFDLPLDEEYYVHRIGRTGRAGKTGRAFTFIAGREIYKLRDIMRHTGAKIIRKSLPTLDDIREIKRKQFTVEIIKTVRDAGLDKYIDLVEGIVAEHDLTSMDVAAALIKINLADSMKETAGDFDESYSFEKETKSHGKGNKTKGSKIVRLFINVGKKHKVRSKDILGAIANESGTPGRDIGNIDIYDDFTFVDVPEAYAKSIIKKMKNSKIKGTKINIEVAKKNIKKS
ncbi:MAG: DEAD/DEAH box helicase [Defluviitaleaceae bacterium]|nr:DEAD/DEAH box helicase [Defluviitaleaceae bacterium]